jgi:hypothetical protein
MPGYPMRKLLLGGPETRTKAVMVSLEDEFVGAGLGRQRERHGRRWASSCARPWPDGAQRAPARCAGRQLRCCVGFRLRYGGVREHCAGRDIGILERAGYMRGSRTVIQADMRSQAGPERGRPSGTLAGRKNAGRWWSDGEAAK